jgi:hypothetical protein
MSSHAFRLAIAKLASLMLAERAAPHPDQSTFALRAWDSLPAAERRSCESATDAVFYNALAKELIKQESYQLGTSHHDTPNRGRPPPS